MATSSNIPRYILITGPPGIGKTTLVRRICDHLKKKLDNIQLFGFYTEEVRNSGQRIGFDIVDIITGRRAPLASAISFPNGAPRVGKYAVILNEFQSLALECLNTVPDSKAGKNQLIVIDEIGKMESFSKPFCDAVERLFDKNQNPNLTILATVPIDKGHLPQIVQKVKNVNGKRLITVTRENRDSLVDDIVNVILQSFV